MAFPRVAMPAVRVGVWGCDGGPGTWNVRPGVAPVGLALAIVESLHHVL